jgi:hypothetical protein
MNYQMSAFIITQFNNLQAKILKIKQSTDKNSLKVKIATSYPNKN